MKNWTLLLVFMTFCLLVNAQIEFEPGYFIDNEGEKTECLIENKDWKYNPTSFDYITNIDAGVQTITISEVQEVGIDAKLKFVRKTVEIDLSSSRTNELNDQRQPQWEEGTFFLQVLVEGKANLYVYENERIERYFYDVDGESVQQLIYKKYLSEGDKIATNYGFVGQLKTKVTCGQMFLDDAPGYNAKSLTKYFIEYNECNGIVPIEYITSSNKGMVLHLSARPGLNFSSLAVDNETSDSRDADFGNKTTFRIGLEVGVVLPFNKNKWEIFAEPTYRSFTADGENPFRTVAIDYKSIELPIGVRHYFFLNEQSKLFINGAFVLDFTLDSHISYSNTFEDLEVETPESFAFGVGYKFNKFSVETRYFTNRTVLKNRLFWDAELKTFSIILGYQLF